MGCVVNMALVSDFPTNDTTPVTAVDGFSGN